MFRFLTSYDWEGLKSITVTLKCMASSSQKYEVTKQRQSQFFLYFNLYIKNQLDLYVTINNF